MKKLIQVGVGVGDMTPYQRLANETQNEDIALLLSYVNMTAPTIRYEMGCWCPVLGIEGVMCSGCEARARLERIFFT
jgi:hypothetical protein